MVDIENNRKLKNDNKKLKDKKHKKITKDELNKKLKEKDDLIKKLEEKLSETEKLAQQKDNLSKEYLEHMKRLQADFENYKKREEKKRKDIIEFANKELLSKLLSVVDNLERALD
ncbi:MAG: nucleotide exchange factor GrpE, partial [Promethearchaeota archaeon]